MSKSYRDRNAYYARNTIIHNNGAYAGSRSDIRQRVMSENGRKVFGEHNVPLEVKKALAEDKYIFYRGDVSSNLRKQNRYLKRKKNRIERARNKCMVEQEMKTIQKETLMDIEEMKQMMFEIGF